MAKGSAGFRPGSPRDAQNAARNTRRTSEAPIRLGSIVRVNQDGSPVRKCAWMSATPPWRRPQAADHFVDAPMVGARDAGRHAEEVARVVAEGRVVDGAEHDPADRQLGQEARRARLEAGDAAPAVGREAAQEVVAADRGERDGGLCAPPGACLRGEIVDRRTVDGAVLEACRLSPAPSRSLSACALRSACRAVAPVSRSVCLIFNSCTAGFERANETRVEIRAARHVPRVRRSRRGRL